MSAAPINPVRTCRYEHGPLRREDGNWSLQGFELSAENTPLLNGRGYAFTIYTCPTCGYTELIDESI